MKMTKEEILSLDVESMTVPKFRKIVKDNELGLRFGPQTTKYEAFERIKQVLLDTEEPSAEPAENIKIKVQETNDVPSDVETDLPPYLARRKDRIEAAKQAPPKLMETGEVEPARVRKRREKAEAAMKDAIAGTVPLEECETETADSGGE